MSQPTHSTLKPGNGTPGAAHDGSPDRQAQQPSRVGKSRKRKKGSTGLVLTLIGIAVVLAGGGAFWWYGKSQDQKPALPESAALMEQMRAATTGWVEGGNIYGGKLTTEEVNGHHVVTVTDLPNKACVEAGWALAREGQVTINGVFLPRISAGKLAELCSSGANKSILVWAAK